MDKNVKKKARDARSWIRPEVRRIKAGDAELTVATGSDFGGQS